MCSVSGCWECCTRPSSVYRSLQVCGPALTLAGYPPYHTRSCEIYHLGPAQHVTHATFTASLQRFLATRQRFGA